MSQLALPPDTVAVITGGASGIGLAASVRLAGLGMKICIADLDEGDLARAADHVRQGNPAVADTIMTMVADVSREQDVRRLEAAVRDRFGGTDFLMNNAGIQPGSSVFGSNDTWERVIGVNLWGIIHGSRVFAPGMTARGRPGYIVNTGSKQGITTPPGDPAYNVAKAGVKTFTEALQHELRNTPECRITAHLLIPGFVFTPLTAQGRATKPDAAWTPMETVEFMLERLAHGDFYILCPDNDTPRALDERRILWGAGDIVENRPPLSRWHPDFGDAFRQFASKPI